MAVLAYGLEAHGGDRTKPDEVKRIVPLSDLAKAHSEALALVGQIVGPPVENVQVVARPTKRDAARGVLLVYVPRCDAFLHRSLVDREWYRRHGHSFIRMEHFEIAEFYGRRRNPDLKFWWGVKVAGWAARPPNSGRAFPKVRIGYIWRVAKSRNSILLFGLISPINETDSRVRKRSNFVSI
jgi:hypothetical protein